MSTGNTLALVAEDSPRDRSWIVDILKRHFNEFTTILEASTAEQAVEIALGHRPRLIVLDIFYGPELMTGTTACQKIWDQFPDAHIVLFSSYSDEAYIRELFRANREQCSYGYVLKSISEPKLVEALNAVLNEECWINPGVLKALTKMGKRSEDVLTDNVYHALLCIGAGLTDTKAADVLCIGAKAMQARLLELYKALGIRELEDADDYNRRCKAVNEGLKRGLINQYTLEQWQTIIARDLEEQQRIAAAKKDGKKKVEI